MNTSIFKVNDLVLLFIQTVLKLPSVNTLT
ncbi:hypothetical protein CLV00_2450 [Flavobacterium sp. 11]|nr:hypothetical protein CLV00_2450 [Flavobacterium sp. 11]